MLANYLKIALRTLRRHKDYTFINVFGLALGLAVCILIGLFVRDELSYDRFHEEADRMYRIVQDETGSNGLAWSGPKLGLLMEQEFPQVETVMRVVDGGSGYGSNATISYEDASGGMRRFEERGFLYADPAFFRFFTFALIEGDPETVLDEPFDVVVTASIARKYFGDADPIGQTLVLENEHPMEVSGVAADPPEHSHLTFDFVTSYRTFYARQGLSGEVDSFWWPPTHTYLKLNEGASADALRTGLAAFQQRHRDADDASRITLRLQPLTGIWLGPSYGGQQKAGGSRSYVYLFSAVALFILVLACINFMNLATARAAERAKEVGVRKVVGAHRKQLVAQFLAESVLLSLSALLFAFILAELLLPFFNSVAGKSLSVTYGDARLWAVLLGLVVATGLAAGSYPAFYLSGFLPAVITRSGGGSRAHGAGLRKGLVVFQFTISIVLLVGTAVVYQQLRFVQHARLGFDEEQVVVLSNAAPLMGTEDAPPRYEALQAELMQQAAVRQVTAATSRPGTGSHNQYVWEAEGLPDEPNRQHMVEMVGERFFEMLDLEVVAGRPLRAGASADIGTARRRTDQSPSTDVFEERGFVINEAAARRLGWTPQEAVGKQMRFYIKENDVIYQDYRGRVVGVVEDYHHASLHEPIRPMAFMSAKTPRGNYLLGSGAVLVKLAPGDAQQALGTLERVWEHVVPEHAFEAAFLDQHLAELYRAEKRLGRVIGAFTILAVLIACLGLFGLASFTADQRTKEIGIRKVLGAPVSVLVALLSKDFLRLVAVAFVLGAPLAYLAMQYWLRNFAYRIELSWPVFLSAGLMTLVIAVLTVSYQAVRAALADPVESLRSE